MKDWLDLIFTKKEITHFYTCGTETSQIHVWMDHKPHQEGGKKHRNKFKPSNHQCQLVDLVLAVAGSQHDKEIAAITELMRLQRMPSSDEMRKSKIDWVERLNSKQLVSR